MLSIYTVCVRNHGWVSLNCDVHVFVIIMNYRPLAEDNEELKFKPKCGTEKDKGIHLNARTAGIKL